MYPIKLFQVAITYNCNKNCNYCFVGNLKGSYEDMDLDNFKELLEWLEKNNIKSFNLTGGEPTIHPRINEFIDLAHKKNFKLNIFSNGLYPESSIKNLKHVNSFLINYNPKSHYTQREYELLHNNLKNLKKENVKVTIMFNITDEINSCEHILKVCNNYKITDVLLDLIIPNSLKSNYFIDTYNFHNKKAILLSFMEQLRSNNIKLRISRPMPKCLFTKKELQKLKKLNEVYFKCGTGNTIVAVNPDLTTFPCLSIFFRGPRITSFKNIAEFRQFYKKSINNLQWQKFLYDKCKSCIYYIRRECQGACLCHKCREFNVRKSDRYTIYSQYEINKIKGFVLSVEKAVTKLDSIFGKINKKINIYLFDNKEDLFFYSGAYHYPDWVSGFTTSNMTYFQYGNMGARSLVHELCHLYIQNLAKNKIPTWLNEGFSEFVSNEDNAHKLKELMKKKKLLSFKKLSNCKDLLEYDKDILDSNICYNQSHNFVRYLVNNFGIDKVMKFVTNKYDDFYKHFFDITEKDFFEVEKEWLKNFS